MEIKNHFKSIYNGKKVLITGHTGFKGSWLAYWLSLLGAEIYGFSNGIPSKTNHYEILELDSVIKKSILGNIENQEEINFAIKTINPDIIFHLAAQSLVRESYINPISTLKTNIIGTANILNSCRNQKKIKAIINVTSDKCYQNTENNHAFKEEDPMGGYDPYSSSKGAAELITNSLRNSFFNINDYQTTHHTLIASVRAGNVIGGGDWAKDRLIPDIIRKTSTNAITTIRNPKATRPWQHVLEPLSGYLLLGQKLLEGQKQFSGGWNFGPLNNEALSVEKVIKISSSTWNNIKTNFPENLSEPYEAKFLKLDCSKANFKLNWKPVWSADEAIKITIDWYKKYYNNKTINTKKDLVNYINQAKEQNCIWTK